MKVPVAEAPEGLKELVNLFSNDYEVYVSKEIQIKGDPTLFEEVMRNVYSFNGKKLWKLKWIRWIPTMFVT